MKKYLKELIVLSLPLIVGNVSQMLIGAGDIFIAGRHSTDTLAAISIGNAISMMFFMFGAGIMVAITPVLSNFRGERKGSARYFKTTLIFAMLSAGIFGFLSILSLPLINKLGFEPQLVPLIKEYIIIVAFSFFGAYLHFAIKEFLQAHEIVVFPNVIAVVAIFTNLFLNWALVFGKFGLPEMGVAGLAVATFTTRTVMGLVLFAYAYKYMAKSAPFDLPYIRTLTKVGMPIALAILFEFFAFNFTTIVAGRISGAAAAANAVVMTLSSTAFMVPLAISNAIAVKVGFANGARNFEDLKKYSFVGEALTIGFMTMSGTLFVLFPKFFIDLFTKDPVIVQICLPIVFVIALFQIFDGAQVGMSGILKGLKMTKAVTTATILSYWVLGMPLGLVLTFVFNQGLTGMWAGLAFAIFIVSIVLGGFILYKFKIIKEKFTLDNAP